MNQINKEHWKLFLIELAHEAELSQSQTELFVCIFDLDNEGKRPEAINKILKQPKFFYQNHFGDVFIKLKKLNDPIEQCQKFRPKWAKNFKVEFDGHESRVTPKDKERQDKKSRVSPEDKKDAQKNAALTTNQVIKDNEKNRPSIVWQALRLTYPHWQKERQIGVIESTKSIKELWIQLKELGTYAPERMGVYVAENDVEKANALPEGYQPKPFLDEVPKGTQRLKFKIVSEGRGNVLLLNYDDEEKVVYCFCPSRFAPNMSLDGGETIVPQESTFPYLGAKRQGREDWWGWIVDEMPPLSWLGAARDTALRLNIEQLVELLSQVELQKGEVLHTFYRVS